MPYTTENSVSPPRRIMEGSPEPPNNDSGPSKRPKTSQKDYIRNQVDKLFQNPEKEVALPTGARERSVRAPVEMMKNVQGSSAGAGSGEFHVYKQSRRREYERLKIMSDKTRSLEEQAAFAARQAERDAVTDAKTAKNRAKRMKRKGKKGDGTGENGDGTSGGGLGKRKLGGAGAGVVFRKPGAEEDGSDAEEEEQQEPSGPQPAETVAPVEVEVPKVVEAKILIHDDD